MALGSNLNQLIGTAVVLAIYLLLRIVMGRVISRLNPAAGESQSELQEGWIKLVGRTLIALLAVSWRIAVAWRDSLAANRTARRTRRPHMALGPQGENAVVRIAPGASAHPGAEPRIAAETG